MLLVVRDLLDDEVKLGDDSIDGSYFSMMSIKSWSIPKVEITLIDDSVGELGTNNELFDVLFLLGRILSNVFTLVVILSTILCG